MRRTNEKIIDSLKLELLQRMSKEISKKYGVQGSNKVLNLYTRGFITFEEGYQLLDKIKYTEDVKTW